MCVMFPNFVKCDYSIHCNTFPLLFFLFFSPFALYNFDLCCWKIKPFVSLWQQSIVIYLQFNINGSSTDGSFTMAISSSCKSSRKKIP